jgi:hypothetical protein
MAVAGYEIRVNGGSPLDVGNVLSFLETGLSPLTLYNFELRSYDEAGNRSDWTAIVSATTLAVSYDSNAQAFFTAAGITDTTQKDAVNQLVVDLKAASLWTKMQAIYPFVGGTNATHKWNLKDPRDLDAAFRLTEHGSTVNNANGTAGNASTAYWDTHYVPATNGTLNSTHVSVYSRNSGQDNVDIGMAHSGTGRLMMSISFGAVSGNYLSDHYDDGGANRINTAPTDSLGLFTDTRTSSTVHKAYRNATNFATDSSTSSNFAGTDFPLYLLARNDAGSPSNICGNRNLAWTSIGTGLSSGDITALNSAVQTFQTALGRNV